MEIYAIFWFVLFAVSDGQILRGTVIALSYVISKTALTLAVAYDAKDRNIKSEIIWSLLTLILGIPVAVIYAFFTFKVNTDNKSRIKSRIIFTIITVISTIALLLTVFGIPDPYLSDTEFSQKYDVAYENDADESVIYDKRGKEYTFENRYDILFYDKDGNAFYKDDDWDTAFYIKTSETTADSEETEEYSTSNYDVCIDEEGFLCYFIKDEIHQSKKYDYVFYDNNGNLYYDTGVVFWDKDGNIVFPEYTNELNELTYEQVISEN